MTENKQVQDSTQEKTGIREDCAHGISLEKPCHFCAHQGEYYQRDKAIYEEIARNSQNISFDLAFEILKRVKLWQEATQNGSLDTYFKAVKKIANIDWSAQSLKQAYYVAKEFPYLREKKDSRLKFSIYREIASAKLTTDQKQEIIKKAEETLIEGKSIKFSTVRSLKEEYQGKEKKLAQSKTITFQSQEDCVEQFRQFILQKTDIKEGTKITITIKSRGEQNEHTKN